MARSIMIATDHSPCPAANEAPEKGDFLRAWGGIASLQLSPAGSVDGSAPSRLFSSSILPSGFARARRGSLALRRQKRKQSPWAATPIS